jgi:hypothetical protein
MRLLKEMWDDWRKEAAYLPYMMVFMVALLLLTLLGLGVAFWTGKLL